MAQYVVIAVQALLAVVFTVSAVTKVRRATFRQFVSTVRGLGLVPPGAAPLTAALVVVAEVVTVALLLVPATTTVGLALAGGLLLVFGAVTAFAMRRRVAVPCQCFGRLSTTPFGPIQLVRNALLLLAALVGAGSLTLGASGDATALHAGGVAVAVTAAVATALLLVTLEDVVSLFTGPAHQQG